MMSTSRVDIGVSRVAATTSLEDVNACWNMDGVIIYVSIDPLEPMLSTAKFRQ